MAAKKAKKKATSSKKSTKKAAKKRASTRATKAIALMSAEERRQKLKPRENYDELVDQIVRALRGHPRIRVEGLTPARLEKLVRDAKKANDREADVREVMNRKLAPLVDRRLTAEDALWRAVLDVNAGVKPYARKDGAIADAFAFLTAALTGTRSGAPAEPEGGEPVTG